jgi:hypothetical protein
MEYSWCPGGPTHKKRHPPGLCCRRVDLRRALYSRTFGDSFQIIQPIPFPAAHRLVVFGYGVFTFRQ